MTAFVLPTNEDLLAGTRPPLPGQGEDHEQRLREELSANFEPRGAMEVIWIADIAHCMTEIEMLRVQIAGFRMIAVQKAFRDHEYRNEIMKDAARFSQFSESDAPPVDTTEDDRYDLFVKLGFSARGSGSLLRSPVFSELVGAMSHKEIMHLRLLEQMVIDLTKERDRIVNQIDRRRRQAMRDAIEKAQGGLAAPLDVEGLTNNRDDEDTAPDPDNLDDTIISDNLEEEDTILTQDTQL